MYDVVLQEIYNMIIALVDDDKEFSEFLGQDLRVRDNSVHHFSDSSDLLIDLAPFDFDFYIIDLSLPSIDGVDLIKILRRRTNAGILVVSGRLDPAVFETVIAAGADMYLSKPVRFEQIAIAIKAVQRRVTNLIGHDNVWRLDKKTSELIVPDGVRISLSSTDLVVMECFSEADGSAVTWDVLRNRLGHPKEGTSDNLLYATIYRLRKRIESATPVAVPLQSQSRIGYIFRAPILSK